MGGLPAVLSGEMKDTAQLNAFAVYGLEKFLSREERAEIFRAMPGISSKLPIGGNAVWGNMTWAPDDAPGQNISYGTFLNFKHYNGTSEYRNLTVEDSMAYLMNTTEQWYQDSVRGSYSHVQQRLEHPSIQPCRRASQSLRDASRARPFQSAWWSEHWRSCRYSWETESQ